MKSQSVVECQRAMVMMRNERDAHDNAIDSNGGRFIIGGRDRWNKNARLLLQDAMNARKPLIVDDRFDDVLNITQDDMFNANPLGMTTAEIADASMFIECVMLDTTTYTPHLTNEVTKCRARLAALRAELIRRTN